MMTGKSAKSAIEAACRPPASYDLKSVLQQVQTCVQPDVAETDEADPGFTMLDHGCFPSINSPRRSAAAHALKKRCVQLIAADR